MIESIITAIVGIITGAGSVLLFFPQIRKSKILENEAKQSEEWQKLYNEEKERRQTEREASDSKIDSLYKKISDVRDEKAEMAKRITELEVENTRLKLLKCEKPGCGTRQPPTGY